MAFSPVAAEFIASRRHAGECRGANYKGVAGDPGGGPYMILWFRVERNVIREATYETYGCPAAVACAGLTAEILKGRTIAQALSLTEQDVMLIVGGLPPGKEPCAALSVQAVAMAFGKGETT